MTSSTTVVLIAGAYLVLSLVVGILPGRKASDSAAGYVAGDRALGLVVMYFITGATIFSAFAFLGAPGWAYKKGVAALYIIAYGALGFMPFYFLGPRAAELGRKHGFVTQAEMVAHRFRMPSIAGLMAFISTIAFVPYLSIQMKGAGYVIESMTRGTVTAELGSAVVYGVVTLYVFKSGVLGVGWTNVLQGVFMMVLAWILGLYLPHHLHGGVREMFTDIARERPELLQTPGLTAAGKPWTWQGYSTAIIVSMIGFSCWPHLFMKAFSAKSGRTLRRTVVLYPTFQIFLVPILLIGFSGVLFPSEPLKPDQILPHLLMNLELPAVVVGLFCAGALAASMSSGDSMSHASASIVVRDGWITAMGRRLSPSGERTAIRLILLVLMAASYVLSVTYQGELVNLLLYAYGPVTQFAPAIYATLLWPRATGKGVMLGMLIGIVLNLAFVIWPEWNVLGIHAAIYGLVPNILVTIVVSLLTRPNPAPPEELPRTALDA